MAESIIFTPEELANEIWVPVLDYEESYQVSSLGRIKSLDRTILDNNGKRKRFFKGSLKESYLSSVGYYGSSFCKKGKCRYFDIHKLMGRSFYGRNYGMIDHIDRNRLNNRLENLRLCSNSQNGANKEKYKMDATSKYKGVYKHNNSPKCWRASIKVNQKVYRIGYYYTQEDAAEAYNKEAIKHFGEFACLNDVQISSL